MAKKNTKSEKTSQPTAAEEMMNANKVREIWKVGEMWYLEEEKAISASCRNGLNIEHFSK